MGRPRKVVNKIETEKGEILFSTVNPGTPKAEGVDPVRAKVEEILDERSKAKVKPKSKLFDTQVGQSMDDFEWITQSFCNFFKLGPVGFRQNVTQWNYPKTIGEVHKTHRVKRQYIPRGIMVDVFDSGTKKSEIMRIKAHLEALGHTYTYILGGEIAGTEAFEKKVFDTRMKKLDTKDANYPKGLKIPMSLAEAGFAGHNVIMA